MQLTVAAPFFIPHLINGAEHVGRQQRTNVSKTIDAWGGTDSAPWISDRRRSDRGGRECKSLCPDHISRSFAG